MKSASRTPRTLKQSKGFYKCKIYLGVFLYTVRAMKIDSWCQRTRSPYFFIIRNHSYKHKNICMNGKHQAMYKINWFRM